MNILNLRSQIGERSRRFDAEDFTGLRQKFEKLSWNVIDNKSLLFLESLESWNVIEIELLKKGWNVVDNKIVGSPKPLPVSHLKQIACEQIPGMLLVPSDLIERSACCFLADAAGMIKVRHDRRRAS